MASWVLLSFGQVSAADMDAPYRQWDFDPLPKGNGSEGSGAAIASRIYLESGLATGVGLNLGTGMQITHIPGNPIGAFNGPEVGVNLGSHGAMLRVGIRSSSSIASGVGVGWQEESLWSGQHFRGLYVDLHYILYQRLSVVQNLDERRIRYGIGLRLDAIGWCWYASC